MLDDIKKFFEKNNISSFRFKQLEDSVFKQSIIEFTDMTNFTKQLREDLKDEFGSCVSLELVDVHEISNTVKFVLKTVDGFFIETVLMLHSKRRTVCVSSQVFCALGCKFCATGANDFKRNLSVSEIVGQVLFVNNYLKNLDRGVENDEKEQATNVVFMGMGEPFLNYDSVVVSIKMFNDRDKFDIGARHITVSTAGIVPRIYDFANLGLQIRLAISFHASNDKLRSSIMPINDKYLIDELLKAVDEFILKTNKRVTFEYVLIKGVNDSSTCAEELCSVLKGRMIFVNLLVYNPHKFSDFEKPDLKVVENFKNILEDNGVECTIRKSMGDDISGACGQLSGDK